MYPTLKTIGDAVCEYYPDTTDYISQGHTKPESNEYGRWRFIIMEEDGSETVFLMFAEYKDAVNSVCLSAADKQARSVKLVSCNG